MAGPRRCASGPDRMPGRLQLGDRGDPLERVVDGVVVGDRRLVVACALDRLGRQAVELGAERRIAGGIDDRVEVTVAAQSASASSPRLPESRFTISPGQGCRRRPAPRRGRGPAARRRLREDRDEPCRQPRAPARPSATSPSSDGSSGAMTPTTPVGSGSEKDRNGAATGLMPPSTAWSLPGPAPVRSERARRRRRRASAAALVPRPPEPCPTPPEPCRPAGTARPWLRAPRSAGRGATRAPRRRDTR